MPDRKVNKKQSKLSLQANDRRSFYYLLFALLVLLGTCLYWAIRSADLQFNNSDQLINPMLMSSWATFHSASFPGQHTMLFKWPLFLLVYLFGATTTSYTVFTVLTVLLTVGLLVLLLSKIEKRPAYLATLCLALAATLLLIPAQPYSGGLLPVNLAMLSTRNLEYPLFISSLLLMLRSSKYKSWLFWVGAALLTILIASDKLFLSLSAGGALLALIIYALLKQWDKVTKSVHWLVISFGAGIGASLILWFINLTGLTNITNQNSASPYDLVTSAHSFFNGIFYAISSFFTNFGANPAFDGVTRSSIPHLFASRFFSLGGPGYLVNFLVAIAGLWAVWKLIGLNLLNKEKHAKRWDTYSYLAAALVSASVVMIGVFVLTDHDYPVDARYLAVCFFSVFVVMAVVSRNMKFSTKQLQVTGIVLLVGILSGLYMSSKIFVSQGNALSGISNRNKQIAQLLHYNSVKILVGSYWRVVPIKQETNNKQSIIPLSGCTAPETNLTSSKWEVNLHKTSFAYLLTLNHGLTNYPACPINTVIAAYGHPNSSFLIAGTLSHPIEKVLIYDHGIHHSSPVAAAKSPSTILPVALSQIPYTTCSGPTILNIVAHEDDDLLFMNPKIYQDIQAGYCVRTVYVTAGDAGFNSYYYLSREHGVEAAYDYMVGTPGNIWVSRIVSLGSNEYVNIDNPKGNSKISLIFMLLPDGNLKGQGFADTDFQSLQKLLLGQIKTIQSVDDQSSYSSTQLVSAIQSLMHAYSPTVINTQSDYVGGPYPDHSDHMTVSQFVKKAYAAYETSQYANQVVIPINYYLGYTVRAFPVNVSGADLTSKENIFLTYAQFDGGVCQTLAKCLATPTYNNYLDREYTKPL